VVSTDRLNRTEHGLVRRAVKRAEAGTGLQFCVYLGDVDDAAPRVSAEAVFAAAGLEARPAVLMVVGPAQRRFEIVTGRAARRRIDDQACARVAEGMARHFARGDLVSGIVTGIAGLAAVAGPGRAPSGGEQVPDVVQGAAQPD